MADGNVSKLKTVVVSNIPAGLSKDEITIHFQCRKHGGGDVEDVVVLPEGSEALVTFEEANVVDDILKQQQLIKGNLVQVQRYESWKNGDKVCGGKEHNNNDAVTTVFVSGLNESTTDEMVALFFENKPRSGGGLLEEFKRISPRVARLTFKSAKDAEDVLQKSAELRLNNRQLTVKTTEDPLNDRSTLIVKNLNPEATEESLRNRMENITKQEVRKIVFGKNNSAIVILDGEADDDCLHKLKQRKLMGSTIDVTFAPLTYAIRIHRIPTSTTEDEIIDQFENHRNGGGKISDMILDRDKREANVFFEDHSVVSKLVKRKHELRETELLVTPHYDCFEELQSETTKITDWTHPVERNVMNFIMDNHDIKSEFGLNSMNFDPNQEMLHLSKEFDDSKEAENFDTKMKSFLKSFVQDSIKISKSISSKLEEVLQKRHEEFQDKSVVVRYDPVCFTLFLVGEEKQVGGKKKSLTTIIQLLQEQGKPDSTEFPIQDKDKLLFLNFIGYSNKLMTEFPGVRINILEGTSGKIMLMGTKESVKDVKIRILEDIQAITVRKVKLSERQIGFLKHTDCRLVNGGFKKDDVNAMLSVSLETPGKGNVLEANLTTLKITDERSSLENVVLDMTSEMCVQVDDDTGRFLSKSKKLKDFQHQQYDSYGVLVESEITDPRNIWIVGEKSKISKACEEAMIFTKSNEILTSTFQTNEIRARFLTSYRKDDFSAIRERLVEEGVQINHLNSGSFSIKGTKSGINQATGFLQSSSEKVVSQFFEMKGPGMKKHLKMELTATMITRIEEEHKCIFERNAKRDDPTAGGGRVTPKEVPRLPFDQLLVSGDKEIKTKSGRKISVTIGDLSQQTADVLVNTTNDRLDLNGNPCGKALLKVAGQELNDACQKIGNLQVGKIATTKAGKLNCKLVYHVNCAAWNNGKGESVLRQVLKSCLNAIHNDKLQSIAIPAIGTGNLKFPHSVVANVFFEEVVNFLTDSRETTVNDVRFVAYPRDQPSVDAFLNEFKVMKPLILPATGTDSNDSKNPTLGSFRMNDKSDGHLDVFLDKNLTVQVVHGDITKESTKLIMHVTNTQLSLNGGVAKSLIKAGGDVIAKECKKVAPVGLFSVNFTSAGNLSVTQVAHVAAPDQPTIQDLRKCFEKFFIAISKNKVQEISFSAIGCGAIGLSENDSADLIFSALSQISEKSDSGLRLVRIVIFEKPKFEKFKTAVKRLSSQDEKKKSFLPSTLTSVSASTGTSNIDRFKMNRYPDGHLDVFLSKNLTVQIVHDDITKESTKLIMHVTNTQLSLQGGVAKSLIKVGGDVIAKECKKVTPVGLFSVTFTNAGNLSVAQIAHVAAPDQPTIADLRKCLGNFFIAISKNKVPEISFSAIGCGAMGLSENDSADLLFSALSQILEKGDSALRLVRIVIFKKSKFKKFKTAVKGLSRADKKIISSSTSTSASTYTSTSKKAEKEETEDTQLCIRIYARDKLVIKKAWEELTKKLNELTQTAKVEDQDLKKLSEDEIRKIEQLSSQHDVEVCVDKNIGRVTIKGHPDDVHNIHSKVHEMLKNIVAREKKGFPLPKYWEKQPTDANGNERSLHKVNLKRSSPDYVKVSKAFLKTASAQQIVKIERIQNPSKFRSYAAIREEKNSTDEKYLFHGTKFENIESINHDGWNRAYAGTNGTAYGKGVYFARDASYSCQAKYSPPDSQDYRYVYYAKVLVGDYTNGSHDMIVPPLRNDPGNPNAKFDSVVDNVSNPTIFVLFYDGEHYPEYLITFK